MKQRLLVFISLMFSIGCIANFSYAATVGNSLDLDIPNRSAILREEAVNGTLNEYEQAIKLKGSIDLEFMRDKKLHVTNELSGAKLDGQWRMVKLGMTIVNRVEPYIKIGTSDLEASWKHMPQEIAMDADNGFAWGGGLKAVIWEFENIGLRITADGQYRTTEPDVGSISVNRISIKDTGAKFKIDEWQAGLFLSKKFEIPLKWQSIYVVPYTGAVYADSNADVSFKDPANPGTDYTLFDGNNKKPYGLVLGIDVMPNLNSAFTYNLELRFADETALSLGGAMKF